MTGSDLYAELRRNAATSAGSILSAAREDAERIASEAERRVADQRTEVMKDKEAKYGAEARVLIAAERHAAMRTVLLERTRVVDRVLQRVRALLPEAARQQDYLQSLKGELNDALQFVSDDGAAVRCSVDLAAAVREALRDRPEVNVQPDGDVGVGFIVSGGSGSVLVDGRLQTHIDLAREALAIEIHARLQEVK